MLPIVIGQQNARQLSYPQSGNGAAIAGDSCPRPRCVQLYVASEISHPDCETQKLYPNPRAQRAGNKILDLGCGPGPTTEFLLQAGYDVVAVDFSIQSLSINAHLCGGMSERALFVHADLNGIEFSDGSVGGIMMADFLQHFGDRKTQAAFLHKIFRALKPGGWFYLSFFNFNLFHRLIGDVEGTRGGIGYRRMSLHDVRGMLPACIGVERQSVTNIFHGAGLDRIATRLPFASRLARMAVIEGRRTK